VGSFHPGAALGDGRGPMKLGLGPHARWSLVSALVCLAGIEACARSFPATVPPLPTIDGPSTPAAAPSPASGIPRFFEIGSAVSLSPDGDPVDTTRWVDVLRREGAGVSGRLAGGAGRPDDGAWDVFVYTDVSRPEGSLQRFALALPKASPSSTNGLVVGTWSEAATAFDFGVGESTTFGNVGTGDGRGFAASARLKARVSASGVNVQDVEQVYDLEGTNIGVLEHKGLVPGVPASFERYVLFDRNLPLDDRDPPPLGGETSPTKVVVGLRPGRDERWRSLETFDTEQHRVILVADASGSLYFLAAPLALRPTVYFGGVSTDMVIEAGDRNKDPFTLDEPAAALFLGAARAADLISGEVADRGDVAPAIARTAQFLSGLDRATANLKDGADGRKAFLQAYVHQFLASHRQKSDPRLVTRWPYADASLPANAKRSMGSAWFGRDQADVLYGLIGYYRQTGDRDALGAILGLAEATVEAMTPSGSVWMKTFDGMLLDTEFDTKTQRSDAFIDNGAVAVSFNHPRIVFRRGEERVAGATWGTFSSTIDGRQESVESGAYRFSIDGESLPRNVSTDRDTLSVSRLFSRSDGQLRVRETASLFRGLAAARVEETIEWGGAAPMTLNEVRVGLGDFFEYGDGVNETSQNRYGFSRAIEGVPPHVGFWMEGLPEPLWGDDFADGSVDLTAAYRKYRPRFLAVFGYDKAQIYYVPQTADAVVLSNANGGASDRAATKDGYRGWESLEVRYRPDIRLAPGERYAAPAVFTYTLWAPLFSADGDTVPDELQSLGPIWTDLVETVSGARSADHPAASRDSSASRGRRGLAHVALESDHAYAAMQAAWMATSDLLRDLLQSATPPENRAEIEGRERTIRAAALRGAEFSLLAMTHLRNRLDLMPAYGIMRSYAFHVAVFDWAYRETCDTRYRDAMLYLCNQIASSDRDGGLQVTDPSRPNYGAYLVNEQSRTSGENDLDDQGMKLWALRIAFDRTGDARYRRSAELFVDHWVKVRASDHAFFGTSKVFDRYEVTGAGQQATPFGHYALMRGLAAWADVHPRARELYETGLKNATERHTIRAVGTTGVYQMGLTGEGPADFGTSAELAGMFLWALTSGRPDGPHGGACLGTHGASVRPQAADLGR